MDMCFNTLHLLGIYQSFYLLQLILVSMPVILWMCSMEHCDLLKTDPRFHACTSMDVLHGAL